MNKLICLLLLFFGLASCLKWKIEPTCEIPPPRAAHRLVNVDNELIVLWGGYFECFEPVTDNCDHIFREDLWHYDLNNNKWKLVNVTGPKPQPRAFFGANLWEQDSGSVVVVYGGIKYNATFTSFTIFGDIWFYDAYAKTWTEINATNSGPGPRAGPSVAIYKNDMYVFGGVSSQLQILNDLWKFDLVHKNWTLMHANGTAGTPLASYLAPFKLDKERKQIVLYGGSILVVGGGILTNETWLYSIENNNWTQVPNPPPARVHGSAEVLGDQFVIAFGDLQVTANGTDQCITSTISSGHKPTKEVWALNLVNNTWTQLDVKCSERKKRTTSTRVRRRMFEWGGFNYECPFGAPGHALWDRELRSLRLDDDE